MFALNMLEKVNIVCIVLGLYNQSNFNLDPQFGSVQLNEHDRAIWKMHAQPMERKAKANRALPKS